MLRVRAISSWATAAMLGIASVALMFLMVAFVPLADIWAANRPGTATAQIARAVVWSSLVVAVLVAVVAFAGWACRARSNLAAFGIRARSRLPLFDVMVGSVGRSPVLRRRMTVLTWLWLASLAAAAVAIGLGVVAGLDNAAEIDDVRDRATAGQAVDSALVSHLFGRQLLLRLPGAVLLVVAAVFALLVIARVTSAQYGRVARMRGAVAASTLSALRTTDDDWTVVLTPAAPAAPVGGTIRP